MAGPSVEQDSQATDSRVSASGAALAGLVDLLSGALSPSPVVVDDGRLPAGEPARSGVSLRPVSLARVGRSRRRGVLLDLELAVAVTMSGPHALDQLERALVALEGTSLATSPLPVAGVVPAVATPAGGASTDLPSVLGLLVRLPVAVPLDEPSPPLVTVPPIVQVHQVRQVTGRLVDRRGRGISAATVTSSLTRATSVTGSDGTFQTLVTAGAASVTVGHGGVRRVLTLDPEVVPVLLTWDDPP